MSSNKDRIYVSGPSRKESFSFNNLLLRSPLCYKMLERRFLYFLAGKIKERYKSMGLSVRENWDNLYFEFSVKELAVLGTEGSGKNNIKNSYIVVRHLANRSITQYSITDDNSREIGYYHWIDSFRLNTNTGLYRVRVSPELYDYVINLTRNFTVLDLHTAILLKSKYSQKFYEILTMYASQFSNGNRFNDSSNYDMEHIFKERVVKISYHNFRRMFGLEEIRDPETHEILEKEKFRKFAEVEKWVLKKSQKELYDNYQDDLCDLWFDYQIGDRGGNRKNGTPTSLFFYIYTREHPKSKDPKQNHPYQEGDKLMLYPYEDPKKFKKSAINQVNWLDYDYNWLRNQIYDFLGSYLDGEELDYYMDLIDREQKKCADTYAQVLPLIAAKCNQPKFKSGSESFQHDGIVKWVFQVNLQSKYGWSIPPMSPRISVETKQ